MDLPNDFHGIDQRTPGLWQGAFEFHPPSLEEESS
jgi:hypothetical protein